VIPIAPHISSFLVEHLSEQRGASDHTCASYAYSFLLLFEYASQQLGKRPAELRLEQLDAALIGAFLQHIEEVRGNCAATRKLFWTPRILGHAPEFETERCYMLRLRRGCGSQNSSDSDSMI
jgi:hypothetical protein